MPLDISWKFQTSEQGNASCRVHTETAATSPQNLGRIIEIVSYLTLRNWNADNYEGRHEFIKYCNEFISAYICQKV